MYRNFEERFKWAILAFAQPVNIQKTLLPEGSYIREEIVLEYEEAIGENFSHLPINLFNIK